MSDPGRRPGEGNLELIAILGVVAALVALDVLALRFGHDSRDGVLSEEHRRGQSWWAGTGINRGQARGTRQHGGDSWMFDPFHAESHARHRQQDLLREAAQVRLLAEARRERPQSAWAPAFRAAVAHRIGTQLVRLGCWLQTLATSIPVDGSGEFVAGSTPAGGPPGGGTTALAQ
jgi:hypothetical protein